MTAYAVVQISIHDRRRDERYASRFMGRLSGTGGRLLTAVTSPVPSDDDAARRT